MASPSKPSSPSPTNPDPPSSPTAEEENEDIPAGKFLPILKWKEADFWNLMIKVQMPAAFGVTYPQEGETASDALAGYVSMFADRFVLQYPHCQPSQLGMVHARHFEYLFRSHNIVPLVEDFRRFYQMTVTLGFFSFSLRKVAPKLMTAPKGLTKWKAKFFYVKEAAVTCKLHFRNMTGNIATKQLSTPVVGEQAWLGYLRVVPLKALGNRQLQYLHMMLWGKPGQKTKLVLKENGEGKA
ncbi:hypothetical protein Hdeb2414_s0018g00514781 [Helianthus debilis subsp. tardiflorus]